MAAEKKPREYNKDDPEDIAFTELYKEIIKIEGWNKNWITFAYTFWCKGLEYAKEHNSLMRNIL